jgi:hypothetical protein
MIVEEPVILALLATTGMQRLQGVLQHGISALIDITAPVTRWEHSLGVMRLIRWMGGGIEEQLAGLLHDVSHTAFSHVIDYVVAGHDSQSYHDEMKETYVAGTDIPAALAQFGYDWRMLLDEAGFPLLEQPAPRLCADRLDYFLRDAMELRLATPAGVRAALAHLVVHDRRIMVDDLATARWLGYTYIAADKASWANFREVGLYELAARAIRRGLACGAITEANFWGEDRPVWARLQAFPDPELQRLLSLVSPDTRFLWDDKEPTFRISTKIRTIDPEVIIEGQAVPLSLLDERFGRYHAHYLETRQGKWPFRVLSPA